MLSIGRLDATHGADYYLDRVANSIDDYYMGRGEAAGYWVGSGATRLKVSGEVGAEALRSVLAGNHPVTGESLLKYRHSSRRPGFDLTFSSPKSLSILWAFGDQRLSELPEAIRARLDPGPQGEGRVADMVAAAHDEAVAETLGFLEKEVCWTRRGTGGKEAERASGFIAAAFRHRTSRARDPQLHTHVLVANVVEGEDGCYSAIDARHLYAWKMTAGALYRSTLRAKLAPLGLCWDIKANGLGEVSGIDKALIRAFSKRRVDIEEAMARSGSTTPRGAEIAALASRRRKGTVVSIDVLRSMWSNELSTHVVGRGDLQHPATPEDLLGALGRNEGGLIAASTERDRIDALVDAQALHDAAESRVPEGYVRFGEEEDVASLTQASSTFSRRDAMRALATLLDAPPQRVVDLTDQLVEHPGVIRVLADKDLAGEFVRGASGRIVPGLSGDRRYTTADMVAVERSLIDAAMKGVGANRGLVDEPTLQETIARFPQLDTEQAEAVKKLCGSGNSLDVVLGPAGTGKTFLLSAARSAWVTSGYKVIGCSLAARAAAQLEAGSGIASSTIHLLLQDLDKNGSLDAKTVVVVDETGMVGSRLLARLAHHVEAAGAKWVWSGDVHQLPEIDAGGALRGVARRLGGEVIELATNRRQVSEWEQAALIELAQGDVETAITCYAGHDRIIFADDAPKACAQLVADWWKVHDTSTAIIQASRRVDVYLLNELARSMRMEAGELGEETVTSSGKSFRVGDRVVMLKNRYDVNRHLRNGELGTVRSVESGGEMTVGLDMGEVIEVPRDYAEVNVGLGYAVTLHKAQGATADHAFLLGTDHLFREAAYTGMSRGRIANNLYWVCPDNPRWDIGHLPSDLSHDDSPHESLMKAVTDSRAHFLAHDFDPPGPAEEPGKLQERSVEWAGLAWQLGSTLPDDVDGLLAQAWSHYLDDSHEGLHPAGTDATGAAEAEIPQEHREARQVLGQLIALAERRHSWIGDHGSDLARFAYLNRLIERHEGALGAAAAYARPGYLRAELGPLPVLPSDVAAWRRTAGAIEGYRSRWNLTDTTSALGAPPQPRVQHADWERARNLVDAYRSRVATATLNGHHSEANRVGVVDKVNEVVSLETKPSVMANRRRAVQSMRASLDNSPRVHEL